MAYADLFEMLDDIMDYKFDMNATAIQVNPIMSAAFEQALTASQQHMVAYAMDSTCSHHAATKLTTTKPQIVESGARCPALC